MADGANSAQPANWRVRVRMYRKWLGDCFLLSFRTPGGLSHIMIDCGALSGTPQGADKTREAVQLIHDETHGKLDALVVTHEHWDHVSGFSDAEDEFKNFEIGEVWAAWTEDPGQSVAREAKKRNQERLAAVRLALLRLNDSDAGDDQLRGGALAATLAFFSEKTGEAMDTALALGKSRFLLNPGEIVEREWLPGIRVFVLGPPKDLGALHDRTGDSDADMYGGADALAAAAAVESSFTSALTATLPNASTPDRYAPFDRYLQWDPDQWLKADEWRSLAASYAAEPTRKIDADWLNSAAELALQLDSYTNNTSLALAFEVEDTGQVLLFVGDAQIGNWLSWGKVQFNPDGADKTIAAKDLLSRTVFYKVGHHGSHNATLRTGGLESMVSPALVAAIPVDEEFAHRPKGGCPNGWDMPAGPLLKALTERTKGRVLRADRDFPQGSAKPQDLSDKEWRQFSGAVHVDPHYIEYCI